MLAVSGDFAGFLRDVGETEVTETHLWRVSHRRGGKSGKSGVIRTGWLWLGCSWTREVFVVARCVGDCNPGCGGAEKTHSSLEGQGAFSCAHWRGKGCRQGCDPDRISEVLTAHSLVGGVCQICAISINIHCDYCRYWTNWMPDKSSFKRLKQEEKPAYQEVAVDELRKPLQGIITRRSVVRIRAPLPKNK